MIFLLVKLRCYVQKDLEKILGTDFGAVDFSMDYRRNYGGDNLVCVFYMSEKDCKLRNF